VTDQTIQVEISADIVEEQARVDEICLSLKLVGAQINQKTTGVRKSNSGAGQANPFIVEEAEDSTGEVCIIHDGIEAVGRVICARCSRTVIAIAGLVQKRCAKTHPVFIDGEFDSPQPTINIYAAAGNRIEGVMAKRLVKGVADIQATDMAVARPADVIRFNLMGFDGPIHD